MTEIPDDLRLLFESPIEAEEDRYIISLPRELIENSSITTDEPYRIALLPRDPGTNQTRTSNASPESDSSESRVDTETHNPEPPVEAGDVRSVTIDTLGNQGDGLAKIERGFVVVVPNTKPGDQVEIKITEVRETVAFAKPISESTVR